MHRPDPASAAPSEDKALMARHPVRTSLKPALVILHAKVVQGADVRVCLRVDGRGLLGFLEGKGRGGPPRSPVGWVPISPTDAASSQNLSVSV